MKKHEIDTLFIIIVKVKAFQSLPLISSIL